MRLCRACQNFDLHDFRRPSARPFTLSYKDVNFNAAICDLCFLLSKVVTPQRVAREERSRSDEAWLHLLPVRKGKTSSGKGPGFNRLRVQLAGKSHISDAPAWYECWQYIVTEADSPAAKRGDISGRYPGSDPRSEHYVHLVHGWVSRCEEEHRQTPCWTSTAGKSLDRFCAPLPTRCLDVSKYPHITLQETVSEEGVYIVLSHRWDGLVTDRIKTTTDNVGERYRGFSAHQLSPNLKDAVEFTHLLGIRFVWIDALCIIQGADGDFQTEAGRMLSYYENAYLTLSVALPANSKGFLGARPGVSGILATMPYYYPSPERNLRGWYCIAAASKPEFEDTIGKNPLHRRGWVFQEDMISRRILHVTETDMWFECASDSPHDTWDIPCAGGHQGRSGFLEGKIDWHKVVEVYSLTDLSFPSQDSILALAGIAEGWEQTKRQRIMKTGDSETLSYVAGLWLDQIHLDLLWQQDTKLPLAAPQPSNCGAPTWSWASHTYAVVWHLLQPASYQKKLEVSSCYDPRPDTEREHGALYTTLNSTVHLLARSDLVPVSIGPPIAKADLIIVAKIANCTPDFAESRPRAVYAGDPSANEMANSAVEVIGWASVEHGHGTQILEKGQPLRAYALTICYHRSKAEGSYRRGRYGKVSDVLFVMPSEIEPEPYHPQPAVPRFRRVGMGMIYGAHSVVGAQQSVCLV